jgi:hypothetical protein
MFLVCVHVEERQKQLVIIVTARVGHDDLCGGSIAGSCSGKATPEDSVFRVGVQVAGALDVEAKRQGDDVHLVHPGGGVVQAAGSVTQPS